MPGPLDNARHERSINEFLTQKLSALRQLGAMIGLFPAAAEAAARNRKLIGERTILAAALVLCSDNASAINRAACATILDAVSLDWRKAARPEILGWIIDRNSNEARKWRRDVIANDNGKCAACGSAENLHAHHIVRWADCPELRIEPTNGKTLCERCHIAEHRRYG